MSETILSLDNVVKSHGRTRVLHGVTLDIPRGQFVLLMGGSGSGKTTMIRLVAGLERPDAGCVTLRGRRVDSRSDGIFVPPERRGLGMVFQDYALWPHLTCLENIVTAMPGHGRDRGERARALLRDVSMAGLEGRYPAQLSGGQQQRVGLARALAARPDLLLLDEPLSGLDVEVRGRMRDQIRRLVRETGCSALFVTHDPVDVWRLADRVLMLEGGKIMQDATPDALYGRPLSPRIARMTGAEGALPVVLRRRDAQWGFDGGFGFQDVTPIGVREEGPACAYLRPEGVRQSARGHAAIRRDMTFEAGRWRTLWHLPSLDWSVHSLEADHPPEQTFLNFDDRHLFAYPAS
ncbi:iron ABC transporter ATP-binding protein [Gluconacetobacter liquefaciens]|uniref:ABC transporter ATP-binding protein n=1 Tax=Gluconacetobacter liquefaciens TaxID=89584 RepID=A0A370G6B4_GLULI|nr:ABC transporter ATP-binding protein [Gluconacetobacter liquefaciens]MBB2185549.1 ABC transporter ATP-binding protein [Gluconacetobacter liquefaciens]RDI39352.1 iron(III) transport system ATP-binding protein [Gluconacetobacter liquefaciens]GBQ99597.1 sugar ABC transporter ATP-binding protein [Gluconacetobacter liquefaciens NRIC 0522]GEB35993.1 iron ABC transporter ATP-binding protein [Gluconacetobacter liquefaciens]